MDIKKIDIGGGLIRGQAEHFCQDKSNKIILSHTGRVLNNREKEIGQRASFGQVDVLIPSNSDYYKSYAQTYLQAYFPDLDPDAFRDLLNCPLITFNPGTIIVKQGGDNNYIYLSLTGTVEVIDTQRDTHQFLGAGSMIGEMSSLLNLKRLKTYVSQGHVTALKIPGNRTSIALT